MLLYSIVTILCNRDLDTFVYDGTVLDYLVSQNEECRLLTVGQWYAMSGYGLAFSRNSKYLDMFNRRLLDFRENGKSDGHTNLINNININ